MIFAEIQDKPSTKELLKVLEQKFGSIEWGDQGTLESPDAYFWICGDGAKVAVDNLTSLEFQIKCDRSDCPLIRDVIEVLSKAFRIEVFDDPEPEADE